jgi:hypothetical protein
MRFAECFKEKRQRSGGNGRCADGAAICLQLKKLREWLWRHMREPVAWLD